MAVISGPVGHWAHLRYRLGASPADADLLRQYAESRCDAAFAELVRRFAPMVWGVCRRTIGDHQLAEDAYQATFVVLARKADSIRVAVGLGGWLHAVAVHASLRARAMIERQRRAETGAELQDVARNVDPATDPDVLRVLDEEIARLPEKLKTAVVLCELDGLSRKAAAARLAIAEGTLSSRLATARKRLAAALRRRSVTLAAAGIAALLVPTAAPALAPEPSELTRTLADGAIRTMFLNKLTLLTAAAVALLVVAVGLNALSPAAADPPRAEFPKAPTPSRPMPEAEKEGVILVGVQEDNECRLELLKPNGDKIAVIRLGDTAMNRPALSRDGKRVAVWAQDAVKLGRPIRVGMNTLDGTLRVYDIENPEEPLAKFEHKLSGAVVFAPDGQSLFALEQSDYSSPQKPEPQFTTYRFDLKTKKKVKVDLPAGHKLADVTPDGKALLTNAFEKTEGKLHVTPQRVPLVTLKPEPLTKLSVRAERLSIDGKRFVGIKYLDPANASAQGLTVVNVTDGTDAEVKLEDDTFILWHAALSPDAKQVALFRIVKVGVEKAKGPQPIPAGGGVVPQFTILQKPELTVRNLDGSDPKPLLELKKNTHIFGIDWR